MPANPIIEVFGTGGTGPATFALTQPVAIGDWIAMKMVFAPYHGAAFDATDNLGNGYDYDTFVSYIDPTYQAYDLDCRYVTSPGIPTISIAFPDGTEWAVTGAVIRGVHLINGFSFDRDVGSGLPAGDVATSSTGTMSGSTTNPTDILISRGVSLGTGLTNGEGTFVGSQTSPNGYMVGLSYRLVNATAAYSTTWTQTNATRMGTTLLALFYQEPTPPPPPIGPSHWTEINTASILGAGSEKGAPNFLAPQVDDNNGNITFRLLPAPDDTIVAAEVIFQKRIPALITAVTDTWDPIPDHLAYIYQWGFLALMGAYLGDPRWQQFNRKFISSLLAAAEGLQEQDKNVFLLQWQETVNNAALSGSSRSQGIQSRGV